MASPRLTEPLLARADVDPDAVREQLERITASAVFRNSKRYSALLKHVVERSLEGKPEDLKERTIGIDVFGRNADYDTNSDHVVRSVAGEVRRRLAQYYMEPGRESELRIDLLAGSYVPQFRMPLERAELVPVAAPVEMPASVPARRTAIAGVILAVAVVAVVAVLLSRPASALQEFWNPLLASESPALLCVGGGSSSVAREVEQAMPIGEFDRQPSRRMHTSDALALAGLASLLQSHGKPYRILNRAGATSFRDLQSGPFVLIGGMNNEWTLRLTSGFRFSFERSPNGARVADKQNPGNTSWSVDFTTPLAQFNRDYAIISRVRDPKTEQTAVIVAGIGSWGTQAAGEFVTNPEHLKKLEAVAPRHWGQKNLQVVIATDVIHASSGPPTVLAAYFW